jgi:hypothetical protein
MPTTRQIISAYGGQLQHGDLDSSIQTHLLGDKYVRGGEEVSDSVPLTAALIEEFESDVHFTLYSTPACVRCIKASPPMHATFSFAAVDLDFADHSEVPTHEDFADLIRFLFVVDRMPSVLYETRHGARAIFLIRPMRVAGNFEVHYRALLAKLDKSLQRASTRYRVDVACGDWTRLYRAAKVTRGGRAEYDRLVCHFHNQVLDLTQFAVATKRRRMAAATPGNKPFTAADPTLLQVIRDLPNSDTRNRDLLSGLCRAFRRYDSEGADKWADALCEAAISAGLDEAEVERVLANARKYTEQPSPQLED